MMILDYASQFLLFVPQKIRHFCSSAWTEAQWKFDLLRSLMLEGKCPGKMTGPLMKPFSGDGVDGGLTQRLKAQSVTHKS